MTFDIDIDIDASETQPQTPDNLGQSARDRATWRTPTTSPPPQWRNGDLELLEGAPFLDYTFQRWKSRFEAKNALQSFATGALVSLRCRKHAAAETKLSDTARQKVTRDERQCYNHWRHRR